MPLANSSISGKQNLLETCRHEIEALVDRVGHTDSSRGIELNVWSTLMVIGRALLMYLLARRCEQAMLADLERRGLQRSDVIVLTSANHHASLNTTFGSMRIPLFAYRQNAASPQRNCVVRTPSKHDVFPLLPRCRSSEVCLEWEARLGADHPYRLAQEELNFFSHGAVTLEDNTIAAHLVRASAAIDRPWLYRKPEDIAEILRTRALCDVESRKPVIYASCDAHALRRFVDDTWAPAWKMANGIRLWCIDRRTGETIHLGGEFTWGDCEHVTSIFKDLIRLKILPADGGYAPSVTAQIVWLSDGMPWFLERIIPLFDENIIVVLDVFHLLERAGEFAKAVMPNTEESQVWLNKFKALLTGEPPFTPNKNKRTKRKGSRPKRPKPAFSQRVEQLARQVAAKADEGLMVELIVGLLPMEQDFNSDKALEAHDSFCAYLSANQHRIEYLEYRARGLQIGSGAMESIHRTGSQVRLKRPGAKWLAEHSQALFDWRMLKLVGRWDEFWNQEKLAGKLAAAWGDESLEYELKDAA